MKAQNPNKARSELRTTSVHEHSLQRRVDAKSGHEKHENPAEHQRTVLRAGWLAIGVNLLLFIFKLAVSLISGSLAILSDALHGLVDTLSGVVVIVSEKIKPKQAAEVLEGDSGREKSKSRRILGSQRLARMLGSHKEIEKLGSRIIAVIILLVALHLLIEAMESMAQPSEVNLSTPVAVILVVSVVTKIALGLYLRRTGRAVNSDTLKASSVETLNDSLISVAVLFSTLVHLWWNINIEAPISIIVAILILKSGVELLLPRD